MIYLQMNHIITNSNAMNDLVLLEYEETPGCFHYNTLQDGKTDYPIFSNGYKPVTVMPRKVATEKGFHSLICDVIRNRYPYEEVVEKVVVWALNNQDKWL